MRLSVVIPVWCEAARIQACVHAARALADEVVVVDASSPDGTARLAREAGARVVQCIAKNRGAQLHAGALAASGDVLLFLHADAVLGAQARAALERALALPEIVGGNFFLRFEPEQGYARLFTWLNHVRRRWLRIYYGDSALFIRSRTYAALGGFRELPILEDYELIRRLERFGTTRYLREVEVRVSARRFASAPLRTLLVWITVQVLYSCGVSADRLHALYTDTR